ncbi:hypothetical protein [Noviherbaspirillum galbum]|uniref:Uncharacterized protein n=1 Tax=Noviherbaspirillum galbum TaxID=2709383 RepID=A0A6B3SMF5_9BURK|nr:hypothetical protein [Noviherbaspirillum galbum]NEX61638.1 hypothetical protein [Noviherbaspirillum galbum]
MVSAVPKFTNNINASPDAGARTGMPDIRQSVASLHSAFGRLKNHLRAYHDHTHTNRLKQFVVAGESGDGRLQLTAFTPVAPQAVAGGSGALTAREHEHKAAGLSTQGFMEALESEGHADIGKVTDAIIGQGKCAAFETALGKNGCPADLSSVMSELAFACASAYPEADAIAPGALRDFRDTATELARKDAAAPFYDFMARVFRLGDAEQAFASHHLPLLRLYFRLLHERSGNPQTDFAAGGAQAIGAEAFSDLNDFLAEGKSLRREGEVQDLLAANGAVRLALEGYAGASAEQAWQSVILRAHGLRQHVAQARSAGKDWITRPATGLGRAKAALVNLKAWASRGPNPMDAMLQGVQAAGKGAAVRAAAEKALAGKALLVHEQVYRLPERPRLDNLDAPTRTILFERALLQAWSGKPASAANPATANTEDRQACLDALERLLAACGCHRPQDDASDGFWQAAEAYFARTGMNRDALRGTAEAPGMLARMRQALRQDLLDQGWTGAQIDAAVKARPAASLLPEKSFAGQAQRLDGHLERLKEGSQRARAEWAWMQRTLMNYPRLRAANGRRLDASGYKAWLLEKQRHHLARMKSFQDPVAMSRLEAKLRRGKKWLSAEAFARERQARHERKRREFEVEAAVLQNLLAAVDAHLAPGGGKTPPQGREWQLVQRLLAPRGQETAAGFLEAWLEDEPARVTRCEAAWRLAEHVKWSMHWRQVPDGPDLRRGRIDQLRRQCAALLAGDGVSDRQERDALNGIQAFCDAADRKLDGYLGHAGEDRMERLALDFAHLRHLHEKAYGPEREEEYQARIKPLGLARRFGMRHQPMKLARTRFRILQRMQDPLGHLADVIENNYRGLAEGDEIRRSAEQNKGIKLPMPWESATSRLEALKDYHLPVSFNFKIRKTSKPMVEAFVDRAGAGIRVGISKQLRTNIGINGLLPIVPTQGLRFHANFSAKRFNTDKDSFLVFRFPRRESGNPGAEGTDGAASDLSASFALSRLARDLGQGFATLSNDTDLADLLAEIAARNPSLSISFETAKGSMSSFKVEGNASFAAQAGAAIERIAEDREQHAHGGSLQTTSTEAQRASILEAAAGIGNPLQGLVGPRYFASRIWRRTNKKRSAVSVTREQGMYRAGMGGITITYSNPGRYRRGIEKHLPWLRRTIGDVELDMVPRMHEQTVEATHGKVNGVISGMLNDDGAKALNIATALLEMNATNASSQPGGMDREQLLRLQAAAGDYLRGVFSGRQTDFADAKALYATHETSPRRDPGQARQEARDAHEQTTVARYVQAGGNLRPGVFSHHGGKGEIAAGKQAAGQERHSVAIPILNKAGGRGVWNAITFGNNATSVSGFREIETFRNALPTIWEVEAEASIARASDSPDAARRPVGNLMTVLAANELDTIGKVTDRLIGEGRCEAMQAGLQSLYPGRGQVLLDAVFARLAGDAKLEDFRATATRLARMDHAGPFYDFMARVFGLGEVKSAFAASNLPMFRTYLRLLSRTEWNPRARPANDGKAVKLGREALGALNRFLNAGGSLADAAGLERLDAHARGVISLAHNGFLDDGNGQALRSVTGHMRGLRRMIAASRADARLGSTSAHPFHALLKGARFAGRGTYNQVELEKGLLDKTHALHETLPPLSDAATGALNAQVLFERVLLQYWRKKGYGEFELTTLSPLPGHDEVRKCCGMAKATLERHGLAVPADDAPFWQEADAYFRGVAMTPALLRSEDLDADGQPAGILPRLRLAIDARMADAVPGAADAKGGRAEALASLGMQAEALAAANRDAALEWSWINRTLSKFPSLRGESANQMDAGKLAGWLAAKKRSLEKRIERMNARPVTPGRFKMRLLGVSGQQRTLEANARLEEKRKSELARCQAELAALEKLAPGGRPGGVLSRFLDSGPRQQTTHRERFIAYLEAGVKRISDLERLARLAEDTRWMLHGQPGPGDIDLRQRRMRDLNALAAKLKAGQAEISPAAMEAVDGIARFERQWAALNAPGNPGPATSLERLTLDRAHLDHLEQQAFGETAFQTQPEHLADVSLSRWKAWRMHPLRRAQNSLRQQQRLRQPLDQVANVLEAGYQGLKVGTALRWYRTGGFRMTLDSGMVTTPLVYAGTMGALAVTPSVQAGIEKTKKSLIEVSVSTNAVELKIGMERKTRKKLGAGISAGIAFKTASVSAGAEVAREKETGSYLVFRLPRTGLTLEGQALPAGVASDGILTADVLARFTRRLGEVLDDAGDDVDAALKAIAGEFPMVSISEQEGESRQRSAMARAGVNVVAELEVSQERAGMVQETRDTVGSFRTTAFMNVGRTQTRATVGLSASPVKLFTRMPAFRLGLREWLNERSSRFVLARAHGYYQEGGGALTQTFSTLESFGEAVRRQGSLLQEQGMTASEIRQAPELFAKRFVEADGNLQATFWSVLSEEAANALNIIGALKEGGKIDEAGSAGLQAAEEEFWATLKRGELNDLTKGTMLTVKHASSEERARGRFWFAGQGMQASTAGGVLGVARGHGGADGGRRESRESVSLRGSGRRLLPPSPVAARRTSG